MSNDLDTWLTFAVGECEAAPLVDGGGFEGGWTADDPSPDNPTWRGVEYEEAKEFLGLSSLTFSDFRFNITRSVIRRLVKARYIDPYYVVLLPSGPNVLYLDLCWVGGGVRALQLALNVLSSAGLQIDDRLGPLTLGAMRKYALTLNPSALIDALRAGGEEHYRSLEKFELYGEGWLRRLNAAAKMAHGLVKHSNGAMT